MTGSRVMTVGVTTTMTMGRKLFLARKVIVLDPRLLSSSIYPPAYLSFRVCRTPLPPFPMPSHYLNHSLFGSIPLHCFFFGQFGRRFILIYFFLSQQLYVHARIHLLYLVLPHLISWVLVPDSRITSTVRLSLTTAGRDQHSGVGHDR